MKNGADLQAEIENVTNIHLQELKDRLFSSGNSVIPFIGAGMSCPIYGTWGEYLQSLPPQLDEDEHRVLKKQIAEGQYEDAAQRLLEKYRIYFYNKTEEYFSILKIEDQLISSAAKLLPRLFRGPILTTNLDRVIERIYANEKIELETVFANNTRLIQAMTRDGTPCLWKIHGDIMDRQTWILTKSDYQKQYRGPEGQYFRKYLEQILQGKILLFLGCSLDSDMIVHVLEDICKDNPYIKHYAVLPVEYGGRSNKAQIERYNRRFEQLCRMGVKPIWYPKGEYAYIEKYLRELGSPYGENPGSPPEPPFFFHYLKANI